MAWRLLETKAEYSIFRRTMEHAMKNHEMKNHAMRNTEMPTKMLPAAVQLSLGAPTAHEVYVAGTFNDWNPKATPMLQDGAGPWVAKLNLLPGQYEYKYVVDGQWTCEPGCDAGHANCVPNPFGTRNSILAVS
jgi:5'-AMP-activated protein kinase regulatory beta subunit